MLTLSKNNFAQKHKPPSPRFHSMQFPTQLKETLLYSLSNTFVKGITMLSLIAFASIVSKQYYGLASHINMAIQSLSVAMSLAIGVFFSKTLSIENTKKDALIKSSIIIYLLGSALLIATLIALADKILEMYFSQKINFTTFLMVILSSLILSTVSISNGYLIGKKNYRKASILNLIYGTTYCATLFTIADKNLPNFILAITIPSGIFALLFIFHIKPHRAASVILQQVKSTHLLEVINFCLPALIASFFFMPVIFLMHADLLRATGDTAVLGDFNIAYQLRMILYFLPSVFIASNISSISASRKEEKNKTLKYLLITLISIFLISVIVLELIRHIEHPANLFAAIPTKLILANYAVAALMVLNSYFGVLLIAESRMWSGLVFNIFWGAISIVSNSLLLDSGLGIMAPLIALMISYTLLSAVQGLYVMRKVF